MQGLQKTWVQSLGWEYPLKEGMATHSWILARITPGTEEPEGLQSMGSQRVRQDWATDHIPIYRLNVVFLNDYITFTAWIQWSHISKSPFIVFNLGSFPFFTIENSTELIRTSLVRKWLRICLPMPGMGVQFRVEELRPHMPQSNWRASAPQLEKARTMQRRNFKKEVTIYTSTFDHFCWMKWREVKSLSRVRPFVTPWTRAYQAPPSMEFSRQEYWSGFSIL